MYDIEITDDFSAAHYLRGYHGKCEKMHGHNYKVKVTIKAEKLDKIGLAVDFRVIKSKLKTRLDELDHTLINDNKYFKKINPSAENIARYIFEGLKRKLNNKNLNLHRVAVWETESSCVVYYEG